MNALYQNLNGYPVTTHSYSAGEDFRKCRRFYKLRKLDGWKERDQRASMEWGNVVESAVSFYHKNGTKFCTGVDEFKRLWLQQKEADLTYSEKEGDWASLYQAGSEMLALYEIKWPSFGYTNPQFQLQYKKEVFPGTHLAGLQFVAYVDMLADIATGRTQSFDLSRPIIVDIKTSGAALDDTPEILQLDPQLRSYAWVSGIPEVAFLWMQKAKPGSYKKGDDVTVLDGSGSQLIAGEAVVVLSAPQETMTASVLRPADYEVFEKDAAGLKGKALEAKKDEWTSKAGHLIPLDSITKQKISFVRTTIPLEDQLEQGETIGHQIADIHKANLDNSWPKEPGIRWPNDRCLHCPMRGICLKNDKLIESLLVRPTSNMKEKESDWIGEI